MTLFQTVSTVAIVSFGTMITRFLPFIIFPADKKTPKYIEYLGKVLPYATTGMIVVYCLKDNSLLKFPYKIPELLAIVFIIFIHNWKNNMLLSIASGTILYMVLIQFIFRIP